MSTTAMPNPANNQAPECPPGQSHAYGLNLKMLAAEEARDLAELRDKFEALSVQLLSNAQQTALNTLVAANQHLVNMIDSANLVSKQAIRHADLAASNQLVEQQTGATIDNDDIAKITQAVTAAITAVLANMATGRPPVNTSGTTSAAH